MCFVLFQKNESSSSEEDSDTPIDDGWTVVKRK